MVDDDVAGPLSQAKTDEASNVREVPIVPLVKKIDYGKFEGPKLPEDMLVPHPVSSTVQARHLKTLASAFFLAILIAGGIAALVLVKTNQDIRQKAIEFLPDQINQLLNLVTPTPVP